MPDDWAVRPGELLRIQEAERAGVSFLLLRDAEGAQRLHVLDTAAERLTVGRREASDVPIPWDERVSRRHAQLERVGDEWAVVDDGLSRNGTFVNGERVSGRRRLADRDVVRVGHTALLFRQPAATDGQATVGESRLLGAADLTPSQRRVLAALVRPCREARGAAPATNERIAAELHLSVEAVKAHLRMLYRRFDIEGLPQVQKRLRLAHLAMESGLASPGEG